MSLDNQKLLNYVNRLLHIVSQNEVKSFAKINKRQYYAILDEKFAYFHEHYPSLFLF